MSQEEIDQVLARERGEQEFPQQPTFTPAVEERCQCPVCRRKRRSSSRGSGQYGLFESGSEEGIDLEGFDDLENLEDFEDFDDLEAVLDGLQLPPEIEDAPRDMLLPLLEVFIKYGSGKGGVPDLDEVRKRDPKLYARLEEAFLLQELDPSLGPPPRRKKRRSRKRKKRR